MTRKQFATALVVLLIGGVLGGMIVPRVRLAQAAGDAASPRQPMPSTGDAPNQRITASMSMVPPRYFTSTMMWSVMTEDRGFKQLPALVVWRYGRNPGRRTIGGGGQQASLQQVRMARAPQDVVSGKPTEWEYVLAGSPDQEYVLLYRYRVYEPPGGQPVAEYEYLGRDRPDFSGLGEKPGVPDQ